MNEIAPTKQILDAVAVPLLLCEDDTILFVNRAAQQSLKTTTNQLVSSKLLTLIGDKDRAAFLKWQQEGYTNSFSGHLILDSQQVHSVSISAETFDASQPSLRLLTLLLQKPEETIHPQIISGHLLDEPHAFKRIVDMLPLDIYIYDLQEQRDIYFNRAVNLLGYSVNEITNMYEGEFFRDLTHPDDHLQHLEHSERLKQAKDGEIIQGEFRMRYASGEYRWYHFYDTVFSRDDEGRPRQFLGTIQDISARKKTEQALLDSQHLLAQITDTAPFGIYIYDINLRKDIYHNQRLNIEISNPIQEEHEEYYADLIHPDDRERHRAHIARLLEAGDGQLLEDEWRVWRPGGEYRWYCFREVVFKRDENGKPIQFLGSIQDVTERRQTENSLWESRHLLGQITETIPLSIYIYDVKTSRDVYHNRRLAEQQISEIDLNTPPEEFYAGLVHPDDRESYSKHTQRLMAAQDGETIEGEFRVRNAEGGYAWHYFRDVVFKRDEDGRPAQFLGSMQDITARKNAEMSLSESQHLLKKMSETIPLVIFIYDVNKGHNVYVNRSMELNYSPEQIEKYSGEGQGFYNGFVHEDDRQRHHENTAKLQYLQDGEIADNEYRIIDGSGNYRWLHFRDVVFARNPDGTPSQFLGVIQDVTSRKQAEAEVVRSQQMLQRITGTLPLDIFIYDLDENRNTFENHSTSLGFNSERTDREFFRRHVHPEDITKFDDFYNRLSTAPDDEFIEAEYRILNSSGEWRWRYYRNAIFTRKPDGTPKQYLGIGQDITLRKQAEMSLLQSRLMLQRITDSVPLDIFIYDVDEERNIFNNRAMIHDFGSEVSDGVEEFFMTRVHPEDLTAYRDFKTRLNASRDGEYIDGEFRMRNKQEKWVWCMHRHTVLNRHADGTPRQILGTVHDITNRRLAEQEISSSRHMLEQITNGVPMDIFIHDYDTGRNIFNNRIFTLGYGPEVNIEGMDVDTFFRNRIHPDYQKDYDEFHQRLRTAKDGVFIDGEFKMLDNKGEWRWCLYRNSIFSRHADGTAWQYLGTVQDVTNRRQAEDEVRESRHTLQQLTSAVPMDIFIYDVDLKRNVFTNQTTLLGYDENFIITKDEDFFTGLVHPDDLHIQQNFLQRIFSAGDGEFVDAEYRMRDKDGQYHWLYYRNTVFARRPDGSVLRYLGTMQDITARKEIEEYRRQSEEQYRLLADSITDIISLHQPDGTPIYYSPSFERITGWQHSNVTAQKIWELIHEEDRSEVIRYIAAKIRSGEDGAAEYRLRCKDGQYIWVETLIHPIVNDEGVTQKAVATTRDITARRQIEEALRRSEEQYRLLADTSTDMIGLTDLQGTILYLSPSVGRITGWNIDEQIGLNALDFMHPDDVNRIATFMTEAVLARKLDTAFEYRYRCRDGSYIWVETLSRFIVDETGIPVRAIASTRDISSRKQAETALRASEERLRLITDNIHDMIALVDTELKFRYASPSYLLLLGYNPEELIGTSILEFIHPDDLPFITKKVAVSIDKKASDSAEFRYRHHDGYYVWLESIGTSILDDARNFSGAVFTSRDISERRWMQRALVEQERMLAMLQKEQELGSLKTRMMSRLSHELRTPLAVISTSSDLLEHYFHKMTDTQRQERLQQIRSQIKHFTSMLDNMSLVVKGINFNSEFASSPYDLEKLYQDTIHEIRNTLKTTHDIRLVMEGDLRNVRSDQNLMRLILSNLLTNAMKYSPADSTISVHAEVSSDHITLTVKDNGIGILPEDRERIFEAFFRGTNIGEVPGLGIGLSIVQEAVTAVHGSIEVETSPEQGTSVTVNLPMQNMVTSLEDTLIGASE